MDLCSDLGEYLYLNKIKINSILMGGYVKHSFEYVQNYFLDNICYLISEEYINVHSILEYICCCGNYSTISFHSFKRGNRCKFCFLTKNIFSYEYVYNYFLEHDCKLLSTEYKNSREKLKYICLCDNESTISFSNFKKGQRCKKCSGNEKHTYSYVYNYFLEHDCKLLSTEYKNNFTKMRYICSCGNESEIRFNNFQEGNRCKDCGYEKANNSGKTYKDYIFPSGNKRRIQGYENFIIDELLKTFSENQIITDKKDVPVIKYYLQKQRKYYPDIYIPHLNKIIEVKSIWTLELNYIKNMIKSIETKKKFDYEIWIYDINKKKITIF